MKVQALQWRVTRTLLEGLRALSHFFKTVAGTRKNSAIVDGSADETAGFVAKQIAAEGKEKIFPEFDGIAKTSI